MSAGPMLLGRQAIPLTPCSWAQALELCTLLHILPPNFCHSILLLLGKELPAEIQNGCSPSSNSREITAPRPCSEICVSIIHSFVKFRLGRTGAVFLHSSYFTVFPMLPHIWVTTGSLTVLRSITGQLTVLQWQQTVG